MENYMNTAGLALQRALTLEDVPFGHDGVDANVKKWGLNKEWVIRALEKHPNWNPEELAIVGTLVETRSTNKSGVRDLLRNIARYSGNGISDEVIRETVWDTFSKFENSLLEKNIKAADIDALQEEAEKWLVKPSAGMKSSRFILKTLQAAGVSMDKDHILRSTFTEYADAVSPYEKELDYSLSVNPADYALMSNGRSWTSCHRISGSYGPGEYGAGPFSYMVDGSSLVFTLLEKNEDRKAGRMALEPKLYRQMIFLHRDGKMFVQSRMYPTSSGMQNVYREIRRVVHEVLSTVYEFENSWAAPHRGEHNILETNTRLFYPDYEYFSGSCRTSVVLEDKEYFQEGGFDGEIGVGSNPYCVYCGKRNILRCSLIHCDMCIGEHGLVDGFYNNYDEDTYDQI